MRIEIEVEEGGVSIINTDKLIELKAGVSLKSITEKNYIKVLEKLGTIENTLINCISCGVNQTDTNIITIIGKEYSIFIDRKEKTIEIKKNDRWVDGKI